MGNFIHTQNSFTAGEVSPEFFAREGINGLSKLENMDVLFSGALSRCKGLQFITELNASARLIPFSVNEGENYLLALRDERLDVFDNGVCVASLITPWGADDLSRLQYAQRFGTIIFVHPDHQPQTLQKSSNLFLLSKFMFSSASDMKINIPFMKFDDAAGIKITVTANSGGNNYATFTTDKDFWTEDYLFNHLFVLGKQ
ncbi:MAG: hypothetical protein LBF37_01960 [Rickettsiales bacterium]|jgi:hypothetical protein|nr:hypothetical protein [Rickettsiales bacterium]